MARQPDVMMREEMPLPSIPGDVLKFILDRSPTPNKLSHTLAGETLYTYTTKDGKRMHKWVVTGKPMMNQHGIKYFATMLTSSMTVDKIATFLTEEEVIRMAKEMRNAVIMVLMDKAEEFKIESSPSNLSWIVKILDHFYFANLTAARKGTLLSVIKPMVKRIETYRPMEKKGFFSGMVSRGEENV